MVRLRRRRGDDLLRLVPAGGEGGGADGDGASVEGGVLSGGAAGVSTRRGLGAGVRSAGVPRARKGRWPAVGEVPRPGGVTVVPFRLVLVPEAGRSR